MSARLRTHHMVLVGLGCAVAAITACSAPEATEKDTDVAEAPASPKVTQASSVAVAMFDAKGVSRGACSGTLLSSKLVLTAGHCIAGAVKWQITSSVGASSATTASTPWKNFGSDLSHPEHSDVGLILLDSPIKLDGYPQLASAPAAEGATATRFHRSSAEATAAVGSPATLKLGASVGFKLDYLVDAPTSEFLDVGGAVVDANGSIIGVVSGRGKQTGLLHIARVDGFANWSKTAVSCSTALGTRSWGGGQGSTPSTKPGGGGWGGGAGGGGWGSSSGGYGGGGGMGGADMDGGASVPGSSGGGGTTSGGTTSGGTSSGSSGASGSTGGGSTSGGAATPGGGAGGCPGTPSCEGSGCGAGSNGNNGGTGAGGTGGDGEGCGGSGDNPSNCPPGPDSSTCSGPNCGGCSGAGCDANIDYGACPACGDGTPIVK